MRRIVRYAAAAAALAGFMAACSGKTAPTTPTGGQTGPPNTPPTIDSIAISSARVEVGTPVTVTATVEDAETPVSALTFAWTADNGTFTGTGPSVTWQPSADAVTPADYTLTLVVTEHFTSGSQSLVNTATKSATVHVNNSPKELAALSLTFLGRFADSSISPQTCVSDFSDSCSGKKDELSDITDNRHDFLILASTLRTTGVDMAVSQAAATVHTFCSFTSRVITTQPQSGGCVDNPGSCRFNTVQTASGDCFTTNVYESGRWRLCTSHFNPQGSLTGFARAFFGVHATGGG
jgi:hypothetical protein